ncbi:MAG: PEGA domain-containing protein, partial [Planctomycetota bacterium]
MLTPDDILIGNIVRDGKFVPDEVLNACKATLESGEGGSIARLLAKDKHVGADLMARILEAQRMSRESRRLNTPEMIEDFVFARVAVADGKVSREDANDLIIEQNERVLAGKTQRFVEIAVENSKLEIGDIPEVYAKTRRAFVLCGECLVPLDAVLFPSGARIQCPSCQSGITIPEEIKVIADDFGETLFDEVADDLPITVKASDVNVKDIADALAEASQAATDISDSRSGDEEEPKSKAKDKPKAAAKKEDALEELPNAQDDRDTSEPPTGSLAKSARIKPKLEMLAATATKAPPKPSRTKTKPVKKKPAAAKARRPSTFERPSARPPSEPAVRPPIMVYKTKWMVTAVITVIAIIAGILAAAFVLPPDLFGLKPSGGESAAGAGAGLKQFLVDSPVGDSMVVVDGSGKGNPPYSTYLNNEGNKVGVEADGYIPAEVSFKIEKDTLKLDFNLKKKTAAGIRPDEGAICVIVHPSSARLTIDGRDVDADEVHKTSIGNHRIWVSAAGYINFNKTMTVGAGEKVTLYVGLAPEEKKPPGPVVTFEPPTVLSFSTNPPGALVEIFTLGGETERHTSPFVRIGLDKSAYYGTVRAFECFEHQFE